MSADDREAVQTMKVLLVEDDLFKEELLQEELRSLLAGPEITVAKSVQQAVGELGQGEYGLIVLDMSLPSHQIRAGGAQPLSQPSGGVELLLELAYEARADRVIIVTQYPDIEVNGELFSLAKFPKAVAKEVSVNLLAAIYFNATDGAWRRQLRAALS